VEPGPSHVEGATRLEAQPTRAGLFHVEQVDTGHGIPKPNPPPPGIAKLVNVQLPFALIEQSAPQSN
jgi:hypothetical protein